jgi:hypothetical protein
MTKTAPNRLITLFILASPFLFFLGLLLFWNAEPPPPIVPMPIPNGYDDLVKAAGMTSTNSWNYEAMNEAQLREIVSANAQALSLARAGLSNECRVPIRFSLPYPDRHLSELAGLRRLAQAFMAEGRFAEKQGRIGDAARSYLDLIRLGGNSARGGVLIDAMVGVAIENLGLAGLQNMTGRLDAKTCRDSAATLEMLDAQRQTWADILRQEHAWSRQTFPGIKYRLSELVMFSSLKKARQKAGEKFQEQVTQTRQLTIDLAARAYELDKGRRPASPTDLVPDYLKAIPQDPVTGKDMSYSPR